MPVQRSSLPPTSTPMHPFQVTPYVPFAAVYHLTLFYAVFVPTGPGAVIPASLKSAIRKYVKISQLMYFHKLPPGPKSVDRGGQVEIPTRIISASLRALPRKDSKGCLSTETIPLKPRLQGAPDLNKTSLKTPLTHNMRQAPSGQHHIQNCARFPRPLR